MARGASRLAPHMTIPPFPLGSIGLAARGTQNVSALPDRRREKQMGAVDHAPPPPQRRDERPTLIIDVAGPPSSPPDPSPPRAVGQKR